MNDDKIISHAKLVKEQAELSQRHPGVTNQIELARMSKWFQDTHGCSWREVIAKQPKQNGMAK